MSWARLLALIFMISFTVSALVSLVILDELDASALSSSRAPTPLLRHTALPPQNRRELAQAPKAVLPSRRPPGASTDDATPTNQHHQQVDTRATSAHEDTYVVMLNEETQRLQEMDVDRAHEFLRHEDGDEDDHDHEAHESDDVPSLLFGGSASSLDGISLWSLLWRGLDVDLASWNVDISHLNHTFSTPSDQSQQRIAYQKMFRAASKPQTPEEAANLPEAGATGSPSESREAAEAAIADMQTPGGGLKPQASFTPRRPRANMAPTISILHDLKPQQGVAPFVSFGADCSQVQLALVHSYMAESTEPDATKDSRGDGLIEWFTRSAQPLLFPLTTVSPPPPRMRDDASDESSSSTHGGLPFDPDFAFTYLLGLSPETLLAGFPSDMPRAGHTRRRLIDGDWVLREWAHVPGLIHAQATSNTAGNCGAEAERDWLAVAYEEMEETIDEDRTQTKMQIFFQPAADAQLTDAASTARHPSRTSMVIPLRTLRSVTAMHIHSSTVNATDADTHATATIFYSLRGDKRVFRSLHIEATKTGAQQWQLTSSRGSPGPLATRHGFISQTVALQTYAGESSGHASSSTDGSVSSSQVIASELNWARGPVVLAGPLASGTVNKWQVKPTNPFAHARRNKPSQPQLQNVPPFAAAIYDAPASSSAASAAPPSAADSHSNPQSYGEWHHHSWITSTKTLGKYGPDVHPLSIHRGNEGTLSPLVTAASSNRQFVAFAQVPLITTVDGNSNFEPIEIVHLEADTLFTGLAFNSEGTILAVADNHGDIIILHREKKAAEAYKQAKKPTTTMADKLQATATQESSTTEEASAASSSDDHRPPLPSDNSADESEHSPSSVSSGGGSDSFDSSSKPAGASASRKRHAWEVLFEVILPHRIKQLPLLSVQIIDVPVPPEEMAKAATAATPPPIKFQEGAPAFPSQAAPPMPPASKAAPAAATGTDSMDQQQQTTPFLILLFQGGVIGAMQLKPLGVPVASAPVGASVPPSGVAHAYHHASLSSAPLTLAAFEGFMYVHWDLLLILLCAFVWLIFSLPRFNRIAAQAQQQRQMQQMQQPQAIVPGGFLQQVFGGGPAAPPVAGAAAAAAGAPNNAPAGVPAAGAGPAAAPLHLLNPLAAVQRPPAAPAAPPAANP